MQPNDPVPLDDATATMVIDHLIIRDRQSGEIIVNRRGSVVERQISEIDIDADEDDTAD